MGMCGGTKEEMSLNFITDKLKDKNPEYLAELTK